LKVDNFLRQLLAGGLKQIKGDICDIRRGVISVRSCGLVLLRFLDEVLDFS